eukprot:TRINITY_DN33510_c0_g1_i1.p1 TRINITY_DN33510_c0_g1~~TRINITY_DN33510_c0_g1_i1.p1  ORF type:complete len:204 (+),score=48.20 TRINITY_DN33510_c0_g1_i1:246-857(+)
MAAAKGKFMTMSDNSVNDDSIWRQRIKAEQQCAKEWVDNWGMFVGDWKPPASASSRPSTAADVVDAGSKPGSVHSARNTQTRQSARGGTPGSHMHSRPAAPMSKVRPGSGRDPFERSATPLGQVPDGTIQSWRAEDEENKNVVAQAAKEMGISEELVKRKEEREMVPKQKWSFPKTTQQELGWHDNLEIFGTKDHNHATMKWD